MSRNSGKRKRNSQGTGRRRSRSHRDRGRSRPAASRSARRSERRQKTRLTGNEPIVEVAGVVEPCPGEGGARLRDWQANYAARPDDPFVPAATLKQYGIRMGNLVRARAALLENRAPVVTEVLEIEGLPPEQFQAVKLFEDRTPVDPTEKFNLELDGGPMTLRVVDLVAPIGKGQRGLIVAPPRSGKTILLQHLATAVSRNHPEVHLIMLLIDERPEEVTEFRRSVRGEVVASSMDRPAHEHLRLAQLVIERAKRLAEVGKDVFVLLDSITRLARASNKAGVSGGRTMTGGLDVRAMDMPKALFGTARALEGGGSVTVVATALVQTGSRMDDIIFEEFKGTGNMELVLDRRLAERRIWPAVNIPRSGTRKEEKLLDAQTLRAVSLMRRTLADQNPIEAMETLSAALSRYPTNRDFVSHLSAVDSVS